MNEEFLIEFSRIIIFKSRFFTNFLILKFGRESPMISTPRSTTIHYFIAMATAYDEKNKEVNSHFGLIEGFIYLFTITIFGIIVYCAFIGKKSQPTVEMNSFVTPEEVEMNLKELLIMAGDLEYMTAHLNPQAQPEKLKELTDFVNLMQQKKVSISKLLEFFDSKNPLHTTAQAILADAEEQIVNYHVVFTSHGDTVPILDSYKIARSTINVDRLEVAESLCGFRAQTMPVLIEVEIDGKQYHAVLDRTSASSQVSSRILASEAIADFGDIQEAVGQMPAAAKSGARELTVLLNGKKYLITAHISDELKSDLIIGRDQIWKQSDLLRATIPGGM